MDILAVLRKSDLLEGLPPEVLRDDILPRGSLRTFDKGQVLISPQQRVEQLGILLSGRVHIMHLFPDGHYSLLSVLQPPRVLGADLVCTRTKLSPYHAAAAAAGQLFSVPAELFTRPGSLREDSRLEVLDRLLTLLSQENMKKEYRLAILSQKGLRDRILVYLTMQADKHRKDSFTIPFSREEMASFLCVNRSALSHELSLLQKEGFLSFHKNHFTLHRQNRRTR